MNMSSKVFDGDSIAVRLVPWRENPRPQTQVPHSPANNRPGHGEPHQRLEAATAAFEQRARESWQQGFDAGEAASREKLESEIRACFEKLAATVAEIASLRSDTIHRAEADTVRLSIEIARRVLHRELSVDPSALEALIKAALEKLRQQEVYRVRVCPGDEKIMRSCLEQTGRGQAVEVVADPSQPRGGLFFEISRGALDASVDTQLREIERGLTDELRIRT
jgi:flagellar assembly protein FliH